MKKYFDYLYEITADELYEGLLGYGLFSEMLPPFLCSDAFFNYCCNKNPIKLKDTNANYIEYSSMRNINIPRIIGIPSALHYNALCRILFDNWENIRKHFEEKTKNDEYKKSRIHIRKIKEKKSIFEMNYNNWKNDGDPEINLLKDNKYVVHADISNCFGSIYTHAIPWALVGKQEAKNNKKDKKKWYNKIDFSVRDCKCGETNGILIGPHASNIISEIILTTVDNNLNKKWKYIRNIDDYTCFVKSKDEAFQFLIELSDQLRKYNLSLNHKKTTIIKLPSSLTESWTHKINNLSIYYRNNCFDYKSIKSYLDNAVDLMNANDNNAAILNYAIKCIPSNDLSSNAKEYCVKYILHLCLLYPYLLRIIDEYVFQKFNISREIIKDFVKKIFKSSKHNRNFDGICFSIFFALKYNINIYIHVNFLIDKEDCISCLLAYQYCKKNNIEKGMSKLKKYARKLNKDDDDFYKNWVFVYEVLTKDELNKKGRSDWSALKKAGISFLKKEFRY